MPEIDIKMTVSDFTLAGMHHVRGKMPLAEYLSKLLEIAHGHALEESIKAQRSQTYQRLAMSTNSYQRALADGEITVTMNNVKSFPGSDVTRPRSA